MLEKTLDGKTPIAKSYSYQSYMKLIQDLHLEKKATSFQENEEFFNYSKLNFSRMSRVHKKVKLTQAITNQVESFTSYQKWLLITESWCGDAAQTVPIIARLADLNPLIDFHIILRDSNEELMENYLTNGSKSIPILAILNDRNEEIGKWGPRPHPAQKKY